MTHTEVYIYALGDPRDGSIYYVGQSVNPLRRLGEHKDTTPTRSIRRSGLRPVLAILEVVPWAERLTRELQYIRRLIADGHRLRNKNTEVAR